MKKKRRNRDIIISIVAIMLFIAFFVGRCSFSDTSVKEKEKKEDKKPVDTSIVPAEPKAKNPDDPYELSFNTSSYLFDNDLRNMLSGSELEYCSYITAINDNEMSLTWNLKSDESEVYRCDYSYDKNRNYDRRSLVSCKISEGYEKFKNGDNKLIRDYVMPQKDDRIDMFVKPNSDTYYKKYFILGKYSDMYCYVKGKDIYFEYYWYQDTAEGPVLVYKSTATNTTTTSGQRYNEELWSLFEDSYRNINIIPYEKYEREKDYYEFYQEWRNNRLKEKQESNLEEMKETYCVWNDAEDLYSEYEEEFDSYEDAYDFYENYCE